MGINYDDILSFLEDETSKSFLHDTALSFLKRHSDPKLLLLQMKQMVLRGQLSSCKDMIQMILREGHILGDGSEIYLLRAHIAYQQNENQGEVMSWIQQARLANPKNISVKKWDLLYSAIRQVEEGDYQNGQRSLENLINDRDVGEMAQYQLAHHLFWRNIDMERAQSLLEELSKDRPEYSKALSCLGFVYNRLEMKEKAQEAFELCLETETNPERIAFYKQQIAS